MKEGKNWKSLYCTTIINTIKVKADDVSCEEKIEQGWTFFLWSHPQDKLYNFSPTTAETVRTLKSPVQRCSLLAFTQYKPDEGLFTSNVPECNTFNAGAHSFTKQKNKK